MKNNIRILTAGCQRFREPIQLTMEQAQKFGYPTTVFDLGKLNIKDTIDHEITDPEFVQKARYHRVAGIGYSAKSLHKGEIIIQCLQENPTDLTVYMDGDAILAQNIDEMSELMEGCDIGVTIRDPQDMIRSLHKPQNLKEFLGAINAGIIVFAPTEEARKFVDHWSSKIEELQSDQRALNKIVNGEYKELKVGQVIELDINGTKVRVKCLDGSIYNYGYWPKEPDKNVKIIHCKGLRFKGHMDKLRGICRGLPPLPLRGFEADFEGFVENLDWEPHSISNIEAYYWWSLVGKYKPDVVVESGICKGRSTHVIAEACSFYNIPFHIGIEKSYEHETYIRDKFVDFNSEFYYGQSSHEVVDEIAAKIKDYRTLLIVDGPKDYNHSMALYKSCTKLNIVAIGVHDCSPAGGCLKAIEDARTKFWKRASMFVTNKQTNLGLQHYNEFIEGELKAAYLNTKDHWSKKIGRELTYDDYIEFMASVAIVEIEGK